MSNEYTDQWVDNVMDELDTLNAGPSAVYLIEFLQGQTNWPFLI